MSKERTHESTKFSWEDVKQDKHRHNYLGNSLMAPVGRWQKGKDLLWYSRDANANPSSLSMDKIFEEKKRIQLAEKEAMNRALGLKDTEQFAQAIRAMPEQNYRESVNRKGIGLNTVSRNSPENSEKRRKERRVDNDQTQELPRHSSGIRKHVEKSQRHRSRRSRSPEKSSRVHVSKRD